MSGPTDVGHEVTGTGGAVPDSNIIEQTSVRPQNVVSPGPHHLSLSLHVPRPLVPTPPSPLRHEMLRHIFNSRRRQVRCVVVLSQSYFANCPTP